QQKPARTVVFFLRKPSITPLEVQSPPNHPTLTPRCKTRQTRSTIRENCCLEILFSSRKILISNAVQSAMIGIEAIITGIRTLLQLGVDGKRAGWIFFVTD